jgi:hypothetical protein
MHRLFPEKLVTIITSDVLEDHLVASVRNRGASGYTILRARGAGSSGEQSGILDVDTNIKLHVILPPERMSGMLDDLERLIKKGYHLTVYVSDVSVLGPEKFEESMG